MMGRVAKVCALFMVRGAAGGGGRTEAWRQTAKTGHTCVEEAELAVKQRGGLQYALL